MKRGMQKLKRRFTSRKTMTEPVTSEQLATAESGTYPVAKEVTLVVYGWSNVQPGTLSWVFPSFEAAIRAARALRNATQWAIMGGSDASGLILAQQGV